MKETNLDLESKHWVFSSTASIPISSVFFIVTSLKLFHLICSIKIVIATWPPIQPLKGLAEEVCKTNVPYEQ